MAMKQQSQNLKIFCQFCQMQIQNTEPQFDILSVLSNANPKYWATIW